MQVVENWNSANGFIHYGKSGEFASNRREDQELSMLSLHLLQISLVYINTLMIQRVLGEDRWANALSPEDLRALSPLLYSHVNPLGRYHFALPESVARGGFRPLPDPTDADDNFEQAVLTA